MSSTSQVATERQQYPIYNAVRVFKLSTALLEDGSKQSALRSIMVRIVAGQTYKDHSLIAIACSNLSKLVLRYVDTTGISIIRYMDWFSSESIRRPEALAFDRFAEWLLCVGYDGRLHILPLLALLAPDTNSPTQVHEQPRFGGQKIAKREAMTTAPSPQLARKATCCCWWSTRDGRDVGIVGTKDGDIYFLELPSGAIRNMVQADDPIDRLELVEDSHYGRQVLFVHAGLHFKMVLDESFVVESSSTMFQDTPAPRPTLRLVEQCGQTSSLRAQSIRNMPVLGIHEMYKTSQLQIYTPDVPSHPLYVHQLNSGVFEFLVTDSLICTITGGKTPRVTILSNLLSRSSVDANPGSAQKSLGKSFIQELRLPVGERAVGLFLSAVSSPISADGTSRIPHWTVVTTAGIYDIKLDRHPEQIFLKTMNDGGNPESLAHTLHLDTKRLYEIGISRLVEKGEFARAISVCATAQVEHENVIPLFVQSRQTSLIAGYLQSYLSNPAAICASSRKLLADILLLCYMQTLLLDASYTDYVNEKEVNDGDDGQSQDDRLTSSRATWRSCAEFLTHNKDYDFESAIKAMLASGRYALLFDAAKSRGDHQLPELLNKIADYQILTFSPGLLNFLVENGYSEDICKCRNGLLLRYMSPNSVVKLLTARPHAIEECVQYVTNNLFNIDETHLLILERYLNPSRPIINQSVTIGHINNLPECKVSLVLETYISVILAFANRDASKSKLWMISAKDMLSETTKDNLSDILARQENSNSGDNESMQKLDEQSYLGLKPELTGRARTLSQCSNYSNASTLSLYAMSPKPYQQEVLVNAAHVERLKPDKKVFDEPSVFRSLKFLHTLYDQTKVLQSCLYWENYEAAAYLMSLGGELAKSFEYRISALNSHIATRSSTSSKMTSDEMVIIMKNELCWFLEAIVDCEHAQTAISQEDAIFRLINNTIIFWENHRLQPGQLESILMPQISNIAPALVKVISSVDLKSTAPAKHKSVLLGFSSTFFTTLQSVIDDVDAKEQFEVEKSFGASEQQAWSQIIDNLSKDLSSRIAVSTKVGKPGDFAFTCSHSFPKRLLSETLLPELRKRFQNLPAPLPKSALLLAQEYAKGQLSASCPICVFNMARRIQPNNLDIPLWRVPEGF